MSRFSYTIIIRKWIYALRPARAQLPRKCQAFANTQCGYGMMNGAHSIFGFIVFAVAAIVAAFK